MDYSPTGSSVHGISQARILEWVAVSFSRASSWPRDQTQISCLAGGFFYWRATREALMKKYFLPNTTMRPKKQNIGVWSRDRFIAEPSKEKRWLVLKNLEFPDGFQEKVFIGTAHVTSFSQFCSEPKTALKRVKKKKFVLRKHWRCYGSMWLRDLTLLGCTVKP